MLIKKWAKCVNRLFLSIINKHYYIIKQTNCIILIQSKKKNLQKASFSIVPWFKTYICLETSPEHYDEHWRPMSMYCAACSFSYNYILHFENIDQVKSSETVWNKSANILVEINCLGLNIFIRKIENTIFG